MFPKAVAMGGSPVEITAGVLGILDWLLRKRVQAEAVKGGSWKSPTVENYQIRGF